MTSIIVNILTLFITYHLSSFPVELTFHFFAPLPPCSADVSARRSTPYAQTQSSLGNLGNHPYPYPILTRSAPSSFIVTLTQPLPGTPTPAGIGSGTGIGTGLGMGSCSGSSRSSRNNQFDNSDLPVYPKPAPPLSKVSNIKQAECNTCHIYFFISAY